MRLRKVSLIGVGLLGGSLGMALRAQGLADRVHGYVRRTASIAECIECGAVDHASADLDDAVQNADLIVFCTPLAQMYDLAHRSLSSVSGDCLITDVGSVKGRIVQQLEPLFHSRGAIFVGSHPMAGSEKMGVSAARPDLFKGAVCVVTSSERTPAGAVERIESLWTSVGARTMRLSPEVHDQLVARSSHLPHVLAAQLARYVLDAKHAPEQSQLCANGFRDSTRIASGSPEMWRDIALMNRTELKRALKDFTAGLHTFEALLDAGDAEALQQFFETAKVLRDGWTAKCASPSGE
jgi:prephenate dehydrogenase